MSASLPIVFAATGGTASVLKQLYEISGAKQWLIINQGRGNALSASLQMATYLREKGARCQILFGAAEQVGRQLKPWIAAMSVAEQLRGARVGTIGAPSAWLISSDTDRAAMAARFGLEFVQIPISELEDSFRENSYPVNTYTQAIAGKGYQPAETEKSLCLYGALHRLSEQYRLDAVTVRCFDLLLSIQTAGCVALSILNAQGTIGGCEADMPSLISMLLLSKVSGQPVFMCNPSQMDQDANEMIFAHCTLPLNMADTFSLTTHFESGSSVAIRGHIPEGAITVFKLSADGKRWFVSNGTLLDNPAYEGFCRTQVHVRLEEPIAELLNHPIGNHYIICRGHYGQQIAAFLQMIQ